MMQYAQNNMTILFIFSAKELLPHPDHPLFGFLRLKMKDDDLLPCVRGVRDAQSRRSKKGAIKKSGRSRSF
jgi:hypothetical protein